MIKLNIKRFASGEILLSKVNSSSSVTFQGKIVWSSTKNDNTSTNTSTVTAKLYARKQGSSTATSGTKWSGNITIDGTQNTYSTGSLSIKNDWVLVYTAPTKTVTHNNDGTKSITISGSVKGPSGTSLANITSSGSGTATMDRIYRQSSLTSVVVSITTTTTSTSGTTTATVKPIGTKYIDTYYDILTLSANNQTLTFNGITFGETITLTSAQKTTLYNMIGNSFSTVAAAYVTSKTSSSGTVVGNSNTVNTTISLPEHSIGFDVYAFSDEVTQYDTYKDTSGTGISADRYWIKGLSSPKFICQMSSTTLDNYGYTPRAKLITGWGTDDEQVYDDIVGSTASLTIPPNETTWLATPVAFTCVQRDGSNGTMLSYGDDMIKIVPYEIPYINGNLTWVNSTTLKFTGRARWYNGTGLINLAQSEQIKLTYRIGTSSPQTITTFTKSAPGTIPNIESWKIETTIALGSDDYLKPVYYDIEIEDLIGVKTTISNRQLDPFKPLWYGYHTYNQTGTLRYDHMVINGDLLVDNALVVNDNATFNGLVNPLEYSDVKQHLLPDGDLTDAEYWCGVPNGWYWCAYNVGTYTNAPGSYGFVEKTGYYNDGDPTQKGDFNVMWYAQIDGPVYKMSGNANSTTCVWRTIGLNSSVTAGITAVQTISGTTQTTIKLAAIRNSCGTGLTLTSNYGIKIGAGINHILVSANVCMSAHSGNGLRRTYIVKNSNNVVRCCSYQHDTYSGNYNCCVISPYVIPVTENDVIYLAMQNDGTSTTVYANSWDTYLTVEVID